MYTLVIVDDEQHIREGLKEVVNWEELGFTVVETFADGQEIIKYLDDMVPDVILTDIKMSCTSGMEVAAYVSDHQLPCKVVLLSGFQEFDLARQAISYGAEAYLLKPTDLKELKAIFLKIKKALDVNGNARQKVEEDRPQNNEAIRLLEEHLFSDIVMGVTKNMTYISECLKLLYPEKNIWDSECFLADVRIVEFEYYVNEKWEYTWDQFEENLRNFFRIYSDRFRYHIVYKSHDMIELIGISVEKRQGGESADTCLSRLIKELEEDFQFQCKYNIRGVYDGIGRLIDEQKVCGYDEEIDFQYLLEQKRQIVSNIVIGNIDLGKSLFHDFLFNLEKVPKNMKNNMVIDLLSAIHVAIRVNNEKIAESMSSLINYSEVLLLKNVHEIMRWGDRIFDFIKAQGALEDNNNSLVEKAKRLIAEDIDKDVSLEKVAESLYICPSYLSRIFRKQTGEYFLQYVTRKKIELAMELLKEPQYKIYHVAEKLGYKKVSYFAKLFLSHTGMNPSEYRRKVLHLGEALEENQ